MKKLGTTLLALITFFNVIKAQSYEASLLVKDDLIYIVKLEYKNNFYKVDITNDGQSLASETVTLLKRDFFRSFILTSSAPLNLTTEQEAKLEGRIDVLFVELLAGLYNSETQAQKIAEIRLNKDLNYYKTNNKYGIVPRYKRSDISATISNGFKAKRAQVVFSDGFIQSIIIEGEIASQPIVFSSRFSIGITSRSAVEKLKYMRLYNEHDRDDNRFILVGEAISYLRELGLNTKDYSPKDQKIVLFPNASRPTELFKVESSKLFAVEIFTDFVGISQSNPNGLVQTEVNKRINLFAHRRDYFGSGFGLFTYLKPSVQISKIEENNRTLPLSKFGLNDSVNIFYVSPLEIYRFSQFNIKIDLNFYDFETPYLDFGWDLKGGFAFTEVRDTIIVQGEQPTPFAAQVNSYMVGQKVWAIFRPETKWSLAVNWELLRFESLNSKVPLFSEENSQLMDPFNLLSSYEILFKWKTGIENNLFVRYRLITEMLNPANNFSQFQFGYSVFLQPSRR